MAKAPEQAEPQHGLRVFLCHSSGDKPAVRELYRRLRADGFDPWLDEVNLLPGQDWREAVPQAVHQSDVVVVCLSRASVSKEGYLQKEIKYALDVADEKPEGTIFLIPLKLEECDLPRRLSRWQCASIFEPDGYQRLLLALGERARAIAPNNRSSAADTRLLRLRSEKRRLSVNQAKVMVSARNFYCARWNENGQGIQHQYETQALEDALVVIDHATGLMWQKGGSEQIVSGGLPGGEAYVRNLNSEKFAGFSDWRLPTLEEAVSLMTTEEGGMPDEAMLGAERLKGVMHLDPVFEKGAAPFVWTSDFVSPERGWVVLYWDGECLPETLEFNAYVRAVRSL